MDTQEKLQERRELIDNAWKFKRNPRMPLWGCCGNWKIFDAGYRLGEVFSDYELREKVVMDFQERYQFDVHTDNLNGMPMNVLKASGGFLSIDATDEVLSIDDYSVMEPDEYGEFAYNREEFYWTKAYKRMCKPGLTLGELKQAAIARVEHEAYSAKIRERYLNECGTLTTLSGMPSIAPFETIFSPLRGIKGASLDIRKNKSKMIEVMDHMCETQLKPNIERALRPDIAPWAITSLSSMFIGLALLNVKQFEELYWPYLRLPIEAAIANNKPMFIFSEGSMLRFAEFFQDIPKGVLMIHIEQDDIFEFRKRLPNIAVVGGMPTKLLGHGTPEECVDYAKMLMDTLGEGFILSSDKPLYYKNDARRENLQAVNEFISNYQY